MKKNKLSIVIPAKNESIGLAKILPQIVQCYPEAEILVINDGSSDDTQAVCEHAKVTMISHTYSKGNGASIKTGARAASGECILFMDGDGQHKVEDIQALIDKFNEDYDMVIGARSSSSHATLFRKIGNHVYNKLASLMTGHKIDDLTSGFRIVNRKKFLKFLYLLPNGFSYPTTSTMAFFRSGYSVAYVSIHAAQRKGKSHINLIKDGLKFFTIILKIGVLFSPMRLFLPLSGFLFLTGICYYSYTFMVYHRFTNMSALLFVSSLFMFMMGIISEQISTLHYKHMDRDDE